MSTRNLIVWVVVVAVLAACVFSAPAADRPSYAVLGGSAVLFIAASSWLMYRARFVAYVERHPRGMRLTGWTIVAIGFALSVGYPVLTLTNLLPLGGFEAVLDGAVIVALAGVMIASFPRMIAQVKRSREKLEAQKSLPSRAPTFSPLAEGGRASLTLLRTPAMFLQIAGPWVLLLIGGLFAIAAALNRTKDPGVAAVAILSLLGLILILLLSIPSIGVAWARWVGQGRAPPRFVALPDRSAFAVAWRLWVFNLAAGGASDRLSAWLASQAKSAGLAHAQVLADSAGAALYILAVYFAAPFAVRLAADALGDKDFRLVDLGPLRQLRLALGAGLVLALAPWLILAWLTGPVFDALPHPGETAARPGPILLASIAVGLGLFIAAAASGAAYLTRVYQAAKARA